MTFMLALTVLGFLPARAHAGADPVDKLAELLPAEQGAVWDFDCLVKREGSADFHQTLQARVASVAREEDAVTVDLDWSGPAFETVKRLLPRQILAKSNGLYMGEALWVKYPPEKAANWECSEPPWQCGQEFKDAVVTAFKSMSQKIQGETDISKRVEWSLGSGKGLTRFSSVEETMMGVEWAKASSVCSRKARSAKPAKRKLAE